MSDVGPHPADQEPPTGARSLHCPGAAEEGSERRVFVYGTLRRGFPHSMATFLAEAARFLGEGTVQGTLVNLGSYPGLSLLGDTAVRGDLYEFPPESAAEGLERLDAYEGCGPRDPRPHEYRKDSVEVLLVDGTTLKASVYLLNGPSARFEVIESGDYLAWKRVGRG